MTVNFSTPRSEDFYYFLTFPKVVIALGDYMGVSCHACIGGTNVQQDIRVLEAGQHIVVGTPGRVYDMINRQALDPRLVPRSDVPLSSLAVVSSD